MRRCSLALATIVALLAGLTGIAAPAASAATATSPGWSTQKISQRASNPLIAAVDASGYHYLLVEDRDPVTQNDGVKLRTDRTGSWVGKMVSSLPDTPYDMAVDAAGTPFVHLGGDIARWTDAGWAMEDLHMPDRPGQILLPPAGQAFAGSVEGLYARRSGGTWGEVFDLGLGSETRVRWAMGPDGVIQGMAYSVSGTSSISHIAIAGTVATVTPLDWDLINPCRAIGSMAVDGDGDPYALCGTDDGMSVLTRSSGTWTMTQVAADVAPQAILRSGSGVYVIGAEQGSGTLVGFDSKDGWMRDLVHVPLPSRDEFVSAGMGPNGQVSVFLKREELTGPQQTYEVLLAGRAGHGTYVSMTPTRILDSRSGVGLSGKFQHGIPRTLTVAGRAGIPSNAIAITGNLTVVGQSSSGYASITARADANPPTSTLNFPKGDTRANAVFATLTGGKVGLTFRGASGASTHLLLDISGYFLPGDEDGRFQAIAPTRLLDSRTGNGLSGGFTSGTPRTFTIAGRAGIPIDATAITGNLTVVGQTSGGYIALTPTPTATPSVSTLNMPVGDTRANGVVVPLSGGQISAVFRGAAGASTHLLLDVTGYFTAGTTGSVFVPLSPARVVDTRSNVGLVGGLVSGAPKSPTVAGVGGVAPSAIALTGNATVVGQSSGGYLAVTKVPTSTPTTSTLNFPRGDVRANAVVAAIAAAKVGVVYKASGGATTHMILDSTGYFTPIH